MQLTRDIVARHRARVMGVAVIGATLLVAAARPAGAISPIDEQNAGYLFRYFADSDDVHVLSHYGIYDIALRNGANLNVHWNNESVIVPAVNAPVGSSDAVDAITTASRPIRDAGDAYDDFTKVRNEVQGDISYRRVRLGYYVSSEFDYFAQQLRGGYDHDFFDRNLNISVGSSYGWDRIDPVADEDTATPPDTKTTLHGNLVATLVVTPTTLLRVGAETNVVRGLQHSPYRNVYAGGGNVPEVHPDERHRSDVFAKVSQYFRNRSSVRASFRHYHDDWGVTSQTYGVRLHQYVGDEIVARYRYRYYTQTGADFYRPEYDDPEGVDGYLTGDYRLAPMTSHLFGTRLEIPLGVFTERRNVLDHVGLSISYERYFNSNNFSANVFETGLNVSF